MNTTLPEMRACKGEATELKFLMNLPYANPKKHCSCLREDGVDQSLTALTFSVSIPTVSLETINPKNKMVDE